MAFTLYDGSFRSYTPVLYIACPQQIASTHKTHAFHNFATTCHVLMCTADVLTTVVDRIHPSAALALLFATLVPNVDHPGGVDNAALCEEQVWLAQHYRATAVTPQNALDVTWHIFADAQFDDLRAYLFQTQHELACFRQVVINTVLVTAQEDGINKDQQDRMTRWKQAMEQVGDDDETSNLQQTVIVESFLQLGQAAYVLQDGGTYLRECQLRFDECVGAYEVGRTVVHPASTWYARELAYLDTTVLPLVRQLREARLLGDNADAIYRNVRRTRCEWKNHGGT